MADDHQELGPPHRRDRHPDPDRDSRRVEISHALDTESEPLDAEQLRRGVAEHRRALRVGETRRVEDVIDRLVLPREWVVGSVAKSVVLRCWHAGAAARRILTIPPLGAAT